MASNFVICVSLVVLLVACGIDAQASTPQLLAITCMSLETMSQFQLDSISVNGSKTKIGNLTHVGGFVPNTQAYAPDKGTIEFISLCDVPGDCVVVVNATTDKVVNNFVCPVVSNLEYDINLNKSYINAYVNDTNYAGELDSAGNVHLSTKLPGIINVAMSTYCPVGHIFFLTEQTSTKTGLGNNLIRVDTQKNQVLSKTVVNDSIEIIMWDYTTATMYAWVASDEYAGELIILNITSGEREKTIVSFPMISANGGASVIDFKNRVVYSSLININKGQERPVWVVVDLTTGASTTTPLQYFAVGLEITGYSS